ncbi:hypothetical protein AMAG_06328 [Allomyces macrogynus ATCC 38327]|uniref:MHD1 domain-containing protein n=1 Tax=Allomyces macrogynus (strain ATCC 38327) TaxID=578462 RepID=A0A0L0SGN2_ALLM3|nr:hypothetical protein AMAG_06328 [Allomyces macrogynus ATCC 38327]|eukprot:KNE61510.1 hypothetical protein AMAG_06328 [Allomyces macrogynus ATCC 38327]
MPSQYRSTETLLFGGGLKVKRKVFGTKKTPQELWDIVRKYVRRHGTHKLMRIADAVRNIEQNQFQLNRKENLKLPRYILESNVNLYDATRDTFDFKDEFTREVHVDKRAVYECAVHTALLPFPFEGAEEEEEDGDSPDHSEDNLATKGKEKKSRFGLKKKKKEKNKDDDLLAATDSAMTDIPFDLPEDILRMRVSAIIVSEFKRRAKTVLHQLQKRTKMYPEEELLGQCLGNFYDNVLEKAGKRLEGRRIYDLIRVFMKTVKENMPPKEKPKNAESKEKFCYQYFEKLVREVTDGENKLERTASETIAWAQSSKLDSQGLLEWIKSIFAWNVQEHRKLVDAHQAHALRMGVRALKKRLEVLASDATNAERYANEFDFRMWLDSETEKVRELETLFTGLLAKQPKFHVHITPKSLDINTLFLHINGQLAFRSDDGWHVAAGDTLEFALWNDKDAVGKTKGSAYLGTKAVTYKGGTETVNLGKAELVIRSAAEPLFDDKIDHEDAYRMLLEKCLDLDNAYGMGQNGENTLSRLSDALLYVYALRWGVSDASRFLMLVELLLPKYAKSSITLQPLFLAFQTVADADAAKAFVMSRSEQARWVKLLTAMERIFRFNVINYRQVFPCNMPENELDQSLNVLRFIYGNTQFLAERPDIKAWDEELRTMVQIGAIQRFQILHALSTPVTANHFGRVLEMVKLLMDEITNERSYFAKSFQRHHLDHVETTLEIYLKYVGLEMDYISQIGRRCWKEQKQLPSPLVFTLYEMVKVVQEKVNPYPSLNDYIQVSSWFAPYVFLFLEMTGIKGKDIIINAIKLDDFTAVSDVVLHSSSVLDMFSFFHQTSDWLKKLQWPDEYFRAKFMMRLVRLYCSSVDLYGERVRLLIESTMAMLTAKPPEPAGPVEATMAMLTARPPELAGTVEEEEPDEAEVKAKREALKCKVCVQINNVETARAQLDDLMQAMDVDSLQQVLQSRSSASPTTPTSPTSPTGITGFYEAKALVQFPLNPRVFGLTSAAYVALTNAKTDVVVARLSIGQLTDVAIAAPGVEAMGVELHYANALADVIVSKALVHVGPDVEDCDWHELTADLTGLGKIAVRIKKCGEKDNDIEFYFLRTFRQLKRTIQDALFTQLVIPLLMRETERLLEQYDRKLLREPGAAVVFRSDPNLLITDDGIAQELNAVFDQIGDELGFLSNHLYEDLMKQYIKKLWRDVNVAFETQLILSASRPGLTIKQLTVLVNVVETVKVFLYGDGDMLALKHFDNVDEYKRLLKLIEIYPLPSRELMDRFEGDMGCIEILAILKLRSSVDELDFVKRHEEKVWNQVRGTPATAVADGGGASNAGPVV